jgi:hypothetical protein
MRAAELTYLTSFPGLERSNENIHPAQEYKKELQLTVPTHILYLLWVLSWFRWRVITVIGNR